MTEAEQDALCRCPICKPKDAPVPTPAPALCPNCISLSSIVEDLKRELMELHGTLRALQSAVRAAEAAGIRLM